MTGEPRRSNLSRAGLALAGVAVAAGVGWYALRGADLVLLSTSWAIPAVAALHLVEQAGCGCAWGTIVRPPRPSFWAFFRARWIRASVAALVPVSGVGAALVALRLSMHAGLPMDVAAASLILDATIEMITQVIFTALGFGLLFAFAPRLRIFGWGAATMMLAAVAVAVLVAVQRGGGLRLVEAGLSRLARRWPRLLPLTEARLHERLVGLYRRPLAALASGWFHFGSWLLGAGEIWLMLLAFGHPANLAKCVVVESLSMTARSAGFLVPGALGVQEVAVIVAGGLVGLSPETAMLVAVVKRVRDVVVGVPGLLLWQWLEGHRLRFGRFAAKPQGAPEAGMTDPPDAGAQ